jgi:catechol 2,3-dioxygenase-like lactoylglutathione lyase family enzyme
VEIVALGWLGTRTRNAQELADFYQRVLGLPLVLHEPGFGVFKLPTGYNVEVFDTANPGKDHFDTGPVGGFAVRDLPAAVAELRAAGVELLGEAGPTWQHFRGPDGNVYELVAAVPSTEAVLPAVSKASPLVGRRRGRLEQIVTDCSTTLPGMAHRRS